jgi:hypothetical protein
MSFVAGNLFGRRSDMPIPKESTEKKDNKPWSRSKTTIITALIAGLVTIISAVLVAFLQNVFPILVNHKITETAAVIALTETVEAKTLMAPTPYPSVMPIMYYYVNVDQASLYEDKNESSRTFDTVVRCTQVEVVIGGYDPDWLHITYPKGNKRITGYALTKQFTDIPCEPTSMPTP